MAVDDTSLINEINAILNNGPQPVHYVWTAQITTPAGVLTPFKVLSVDLNRDYIGNMGDELLVTIAMGYGTYHQQVMPYSNDLTCMLTRTPVQEGSTTQDLTSDIEAQIFRCVPTAVSSAAVEGNRYYDSSQQAGDITSIQPYIFQLQDFALESTRLQSVGTVVQSATAGDAIKYFVTKIAQSLKLDSNHQIKGVDMVTPDNTQVYKHISIPHGTKGTDVPFYIAHHWGAPYASGFGAYLQKSIWYLYPLYDLTRYDNATRSITVINVPKNRFPTLNRTFRRTFSQLIVLATGDTKHQDPSDHLQQNHGNGTRFVSADKVINSFASVSDNKATALRVQNATELLGQARPTGLNNITTSGAQVTGNPFLELSKVSSRMGSYITCVWENSDPGALFPGMPCRYIYEVSGSVFELKGQLVHAQTQIEPLQPGLFPSAHRNNTALTLFVQHILDWSNSATVSGS
jgi:hypothetical protein